MLPNQGVLTTGVFCASNNLFKAVPALHHGRGKNPSKGQLNGVLVPNLIKCLTMLVADDIKGPKLDRKRRGTKPNIFPKPNLLPIPNYPPIAKFKGLGSPHDPLPEPGGVLSIASKDVGRIIKILGMYQRYPQFHLIFDITQLPSRQRLTSLMFGIPNPPCSFSYKPSASWQDETSYFLQNHSKGSEPAGC